MKDSIKSWIPVILLVGVIVGWAYSDGQKSAKIEMLKSEVENIEKNDNEQDDFIKEQLIFNSRTATILELMVE